MRHICDQLEDEIINQTGEEALLLVGRSGTGKTTIAMNRMWVAWQRFYAAASSEKTSTESGHPLECDWNCVFVTANEVLVHAVRDVFRNMQLSYEGQGVRILPQDAEIPTSLRPEAVTEQTFPMFVSAQDWLLLLDATVCCDNLDNHRASCDAQQEAHTYAVSEQRRLDEAFGDAKAAFSVSEAELKARRLMPSELSAELEKHQALVTEADRRAVRARKHAEQCHQALKQAQKGLEDTAKPFIETADGRGGTRSGMLHREGNLTKLLRQSEIEANDDEDDTAAQGRTASRKEIDAFSFEQEFWCDSKCDKVGYAASTVWTEIASYIKGSLGSLHVDAGHLSQEEYTSLPRKLGLFGSDLRSAGTSREGVYLIYNDYEEWKRRRGWYDRMDVVHDLYRRVKKVGYRGVPIHSMSIDEVQDFTQAELCLYLEVVQNPNDVFLAGDTCQTIARGVG
eukprot:COSAG04_NODE_699_length_11044_cov_4.121243_3_plen_453_part_00